MKAIFTASRCKLDEGSCTRLLSFVGVGGSGEDLRKPKQTAKQLDDKVSGPFGLYR